MGAGKKSRKKNQPKKPPKKTSVNADKKGAAWKNFEILVADIQQQLAPDATVRHNEMVTGVSGRRRQLDVSIRQRIGLMDILVVVECKRWNKSVKIDHVEAFAKKLEDVRANAGIMITSSNFDAGARAIAAQNGIKILKYREAGDADWLALVGKEAWVEMFNIRMSDAQAAIKIIGSDSPVPVEIGLALHDQAGNIIGPLQQVLHEAYACRAALAAGRRKKGKSIP